jgi:hypothetical protein
MTVLLVNYPIEFMVLVYKTYSPNQLIWINLMSEQKPSETDPMGVAIGVGVAVGTAIGVVMDQIALGVALGIAFGVAYGATLKRKQSTEKAKDNNDD